MITLIALGMAIYGLRLAFFVVGQVRARGASPRSVETPLVSVIVPARNEQHNIERCLRSLLRSTYPANKIEVIVVNDRSTDSTGDVIDAMASEDSRIRALHRLDTTDHPNLKGKPGALQHGFDHANGEILLLTDADCAVHPAWVETMTQRFGDARVGMVCGFTTIQSHTFFDAVQDVEWLYTQTMARAGLRNGIPLGCFGNNMALRRTAYEAVGGYETIPFSITEDLALLQVMHTQGWKVRYLCETGATVETLPCTTIGEYLQQKHRWVRGGLALGMRAFAFVASGAFYWLGLVASILSHNLMIAGGFIVLRILGDGVLIGTSIRRINRWERLPMVAPSVVLLLLLELLLPLMTLRKKIVWKNQVFRQ